MNKKFLLPVLLVLSEISFSQKTIFSVGPVLALPGSSYSLKMNAGTGIGAWLRVESVWSKHITGMATIEYLAFAQKDLDYSGIPPTISKVKATPLQVGMKYYSREINGKATGFFLSAELGCIPTTTHFNYAANPDRDFKEAGFSCAPGIGFQTANITAGIRLQYNLAVSGFNIYYYDLGIAYCFFTGKKNKGKTVPR